MEHAATLDLYQFEDPAFYDQLERARRQTTSRIGLLAQLLSMGQDAVTLASLGVALLVYSPGSCSSSRSPWCPVSLSETHFAGLEYSLLFRLPERRRLDYLRYIGASDETAKESSSSDSLPGLSNGSGLSRSVSMTRTGGLSIRKGIVSTGLSLIGTAGTTGRTWWCSSRQSPGPLDRFAHVSRRFVLPEP